MPRFKLFLTPKHFYKSYVNPLGEGRGDYASGRSRDCPWDSFQPPTTTSKVPAGALVGGFPRLTHCGGAAPGTDVTQPTVVVRPRGVAATTQSNGQPQPQQPQQPQTAAEDVELRDNTPELDRVPGLPNPSTNLERHSVRDESEGGTTTAHQSAGFPRADLLDVPISHRSHSGDGGLSVIASPSHHLHLWEDQQQTDADPAPPWSDLSNRNLMCKSLPFEVGRCQCYILREARNQRDSFSVYSLHTKEGHGRLDRKLAIARHRFRAGRSEFAMAQAGVGNVRHQLEQGYIGSVTANFAGTRYRIWDQNHSLGGGHTKDTRMLLGVVVFEPSVTSVTGKYQNLRAFIPKNHSMQQGSSEQKVGLPEDYEDDTNSVYRFRSCAPSPKKELAGRELDDVRQKESSETGSKIISSAKNIQMTVEGNGEQSILLLGKTSKTTYSMEYSYPLTAQQAFGICLASLDPKPYWCLVCI